MTNCKPGDFAVVVRSVDGNVGLFVHVVEAYTGDYPREAGVWWNCTSPSPLHRGDGVIVYPGEIATFHDAALRPIKGPKVEMTKEVKEPVWQG